MKEFLSQAFTLQRLIKAKETHIQQLHSMRENVSRGLQTETKIQTSRKQDPIGELAVKILDSEKECRLQIAEMIRIQNEIKSTVENVKKAEYRLILYERYVNLKNWDNIAEDNHYSVKWVHVLHKRSLEFLEKHTKIHCSSHF